MTVEDAIEKLNAGADLIQLYTGFIYEGPSIIKRINKKISGSLNSRLKGSFKSGTLKPEL